MKIDKLNGRQFFFKKKREKRTLTLLSFEILNEVSELFFVSCLVFLFNYRNRYPNEQNLESLFCKERKKNKYEDLYSIFGRLLLDRLFHSFRK